MLLARIDAHLRRTRMPVTRFGRDAVGDPNFVLDLRDGRAPRRKTVERVLAFIAEREQAMLGDSHIQAPAPSALPWDRRSDCPPSGAIGRDHHFQAPASPARASARESDCPIE